MSGFQDRERARTPAPQQGPSPGRRDVEKRRLAEALRENLKKRKDQARLRRSDSEGEPRD